MQQKNEKPWPCLKCLIVMNPIDEDHCKCPQCGTEVWHDYQEPESADEIAELMQESVGGHMPTSKGVLPAGRPLPGGGSKNKNGSKKNLMQKPSTKELHDRLVAGGSSVKRGVGRPRKTILTESVN